MANNVCELFKAKITNLSQKTNNYNYFPKNRRRLSPLISFDLRRRPMLSYTLSQKRPQTAFKARGIFFVDALPGYFILYKFRLGGLRRMR